MSSSKLVSIVIPTRDRAQYLQHSLRTACRIPFDDVEIVVSDNASVDATQEVLQSFSDPRIRSFQTGSRISMRQNFEFALSKCEGEYVIFFGDDDGIIPGQFQFLRNILLEHRPDALTWDYPVYGWPVEGYGSRVGGLRFVRSRCFGGPTTLQPHSVLKRALKGRLDRFHPMPAIYHGCMSTRYLRGLADANGTCILARSPDTYVNFRSALHGGRFIHCSHPFSINGHSPASNGGNLNAQGKSAEGAKLADRFRVELQTDPVEDVIPLSKSVPFGFLSTLETVRARFPDPTKVPDYRTWYRSIFIDMRKKDDSTRAEITGMVRDYARETGTEDELASAQKRIGTLATRLSMAVEKNVAKIASFRADTTLEGANTIDTAARFCDQLLGSDFGSVTAGALSRGAAWSQLKTRYKEMV